MPKLERKNYSIDLLKILRVYKEFVLKVLECNVYWRWIICWSDIILQDKALGVKLKVIQLKYKNILLEPHDHFGICLDVFLNYFY
jgi:hypothetical protein